MKSSQHQTGGVPENELELLSAYIDNQLSVAERVNLERRMEQDPRLRMELAELTEAVGALRALEPLKPPRSFTLDPATAPRPRFAFPVAWIMQMGGGLAGLSLVLLATIQLLAGGVVATSMGSPMAAQVVETSQVAAATMADAPAGSLAQPTPGPDVTPNEPVVAPAAGAPPAAEMRIEQGQATMAPTAVAASSAPELPPAPAATAALPPVDGLGSGVSAGEAADTSVANTAPVESVPEAAYSTGAAEAPAAAPAPRPPALPPWLLLTLGLVLIGTAVGWNIYGRRRL